MANLKCGQCHFWYPDDLFPSRGQCEKETCIHYQKAIREDRLSGDCFVGRSLSVEVFQWCRKCKETIPGWEASRHVGHDLYVATAPFSVEEMMELTLAGD